MQAYILPFIAVLALVLADSQAPKCPAGFVGPFPREPTAKNNYTTGMCLNILGFPDLGNRNRARSMCAEYNATLTIPESELEFELWSMYLAKYNLTQHVAVDGEVTGHCRSRLYQKEYASILFKKNGDCGRKTNLFAFDDYNTDHEWALNNLGILSSTEKSLGEENALMHPKTIVFVKHYELCLVMVPSEYNNGIHTNRTREGFFGTVDCLGMNGQIPYDVTLVLCGAPVSWNRTEPTSSH